MKKNNLLIIGISILFYLICSRIGIISFLFQPIVVLVAFLHEFGHASMALITGGKVYFIKINLY